MTERDNLILQIGNSLSSYNLFCLFYGFKEVMKQPIHLANLHLIEEVLSQLDLSFVLSDFFYKNPNERCFGEDQNKIIYIGKDRDKCIASKEYDECFEGEFYVNHTLNLKYSYAEATKGNGKLLGYPDCCVSHFLETDNYDNDLYFTFASKITNYLHCSNFLNPFENIIVHHIPCSFSCVSSVSLAQKLLPYYLLSYGEEQRGGILKSIYSEKKYVLFQSLNWIKIENNTYSFGYYIQNHDPVFEKIKLLITLYNFTITILDADTISISNDKKNFSVKDIKVLVFPEIVG